MTDEALPTRTVETTVRVDGEARQVIRAFLEDADLKGWWRVSRSLDEHRLVIDPLVQNEPDRPILFGPLRLEVIAEPLERGTRLTVCHGGYRHGRDWDWLHEAVVQGWKHVLEDFRAWFVERA